MSAIARILLARGHAVSGSDTNRSDLTDALERLGATVHIGPHAAANVPAGCDLLVHTSAVNETNPEVAEAIARGMPHLERAQMVAVLMADRIAVCVAGCHGKSTTSGMVAFVLKHAGRDPTYLIGAEVSALGDNAAPGTGPHVVVEADEYARAFLEYSPDVALVTNVEADHLDYYGTYEAVKEAFRGFVSNVKPGGTLLLCANNDEAIALRDSMPEGVTSDHLRPRPPGRIPRLRSRRNRWHAALQRLPPRRAARPLRHPASRPPQRAKRPRRP